MKIDLRKRGTGKTTELIKRSIDTGFHLVVANISEKLYIESIFKTEYPDKKHPEIFTFQDILNNKHLSCKKGFLLDDAEIFIKAAFKYHPIDTVMISEERDIMEENTMKRNVIITIFISLFLIMIWMSVLYYIFKIK